MKDKNKAVWGARFNKATSEIFEKIGASIDVDKRLFEEDILGSIIHAQMLVKQKIINKKRGNRIILGLKKIENEIKKNKFIFNKKYEDIHLNIEKRLYTIIGADAGYLHIARSRNDQVITDFKLWIKKASKKIVKNLNSLIKSFLKKSEGNIKTIMPGLTHLKNAQPISFAHYLLAYIEMFKRDKKRFISNINYIDECPLGVCALAGTSYKIDRNFTSKKLGFKKPTNNSIDTVSDRDFALDFLSSASICAMHISRLAEELIIWNSDAFRLIKFDDKMLTGSSIMPQKKNPDPVELIRGRAGKNFGSLQAMLTTMKGLPLSYYKDMQEDKALVFHSYDTLLGSIIITNEIIRTLKPNKERMLSLSDEGYTTATDFADYLVKNNNLSFREAYKISAKLVNYAEKKKKKLSQLDFKEVKKVKNDLDKNVMKVFDVRHSVDSKSSYGGTATKNIKKMILKLKKEFK
ncbi:MAG: argininosuccinate lyase [Pelagibacteraceae bacterium]|jgi:argininosuccinate lyase|nr:argininosuccinate lyase [Candidatus Pelagibacter sp.]MDP6680257.1 argininosuccinate lyase [Pelagibacteraceae bacterium]MDP6709846.1 argininosuccinate lyase [Pelagibacteraceae bacterium]